MRRYHRAASLRSRRTAPPSVYLIAWKCWALRFPCLAARQNHRKASASSFPHPETHSEHVAKSNLACSPLAGWHSWWATWATAPTAPTSDHRRCHEHDERQNRYERLHSSHPVCISFACFLPQPMCDQSYPCASTSARARTTTPVDPVSRSAARLRRRRARSTHARTRSPRRPGRSEAAVPSKAVAAARRTPTSAATRSQQAQRSAATQTRWRRWRSRDHAGGKASRPPFHETLHDDAPRSPIIERATLKAVDRRPHL